jgi:hypothetical protein
MSEHPGDLNMAFALRVAEGLGPAGELPPQLEPVEVRARLVQQMDGPLLGGSDVLELGEFLGRRLDEISKVAREYLGDMPDDLQRLAVVLRLWSGCLSAAKAIALETRSGPNTPVSRRALFLEFIDPTSARDAMFRAGVEAAPAFKALRDQAVDLEGVPLESPVRRFTYTDK